MVSTSYSGSYCLQNLQTKNKTQTNKKYTRTVDTEGTKTLPLDVLALLLLLLKPNS